MGGKTRLTHCSGTARFSAFSPGGANEAPPLPLSKGTGSIPEAREESAFGVV